MKWVMQYKPSCHTDETCIFCQIWLEINSVRFHSVEIFFCWIHFDIKHGFYLKLIYLASPVSGINTAAAWVIYCSPLINPSPYETQKGEGAQSPGALNFFCGAWSPIAFLRGALTFFTVEPGALRTVAAESVAPNIKIDKMNAFEIRIGKAIFTLPFKTH